METFNFTLFLPFYTSCPPTVEDPDILQCQCQHNTAGRNCEECAAGFVQKPWRPYTKFDKYQCEKCNCNGHTEKCQYNPEVAAEVNN